MRRACVGVRVYSKKNAAIKNVFRRDLKKNINFPKNMRKNWTKRTRIGDPCIYIEDPQNFIVDPQIFIGHTKLFVGDPNIFI